MGRLALPLYFDNDPDLYEWVRNEAFKKHITMAEFVRQCLREAQKK
jgi:uncharacterized protein (DUF2236 family)